MNTKNKSSFIRNFLEEMLILFPGMSFRCEFNLPSSTYIIEVKPFLQFEKNDKYGKLEYAFTKKFEDIFPGYTILFISDGSLNKVENPIFEIGQKIKIPQSTWKTLNSPAYINY